LAQAALNVHPHQRMVITGPELCQETPRHCRPSAPMPQYLLLENALVQGSSRRLHCISAW
ncbi:hypothetical protein, partial [Nocardia sp. NPDC004604]|uniref:hypothetical protein n=1 Tax=Nocardia sp. NPDC004604 TaxID=3157013 RepID=UPI0033B0E40E